MQANFCLGGLRGVLRGAPLLSFRAERIAPLLCGLLRSHIADDPDVAAMVRSGLLAPTESFAKDSPLWAPHARVKAFLRKWHLDSQYRTTSRYKFICESMRGLRGGHGLPSARQVRKLFRLETWERGGDDDRRKRQLLAQALKDDSTRDWTVEDLLEAAGGCVHGHNEFNTYCQGLRENQSIYDFYTSDFVDALARRVREANPGAAGVSVVEVGAGWVSLAPAALAASFGVPRCAFRGSRCVDGVHRSDGALAHHLRSRLGNVSVVATDSGKWFVPPLYHVESLDVAAALAKYQPTVVIAAWMPEGDDWTAAMRAMHSVQAYILVGERDDGNCGHPQLTWGLDGPKPYERDGFERVDADECSRLQLSRYDSKQCLGTSFTTLFRRVRAPFSKYDAVPL